MKFGLRVPACESATVVAEFIERAEQGGFDFIWMPDTQLLNRDVWVNLGLAAAQTSKIVLGTNVTNPFTRHATVTASAATTLDEATGGRFILGIGTGQSSVKVMGRPAARLAELRECIELMRALWDGEWVSPYGQPFRLLYASGRRVLVYVAATRPRMLQLAGEIADGVIMVTGISNEALDYGLTNVEIGAKRAGRRLEDLDIVTGVYCHVGSDRRAAMRQGRPYAALYALRFRGTDRDFGVTSPDGFGVSSIYPDLLHAADWEGAIEATDWVSEAALKAWTDEFCLLGTADDVTAGVRRLESYGVNNLYVRSFYTYDLPTEVCDTFVADVIPRFR